MTAPANLRIFETLAELGSQRGVWLGPTPWLTVDQSRIDLFSQASGDAYWVHTDTARAARELPGGRPLAHGYLTLSLVTAMSAQLWHVRSQSGALLYGIDECRFPAPVVEGARISLRQQLIDADPIEPGRWRIKWRSVIDVEHGPKPACVATILSLLFE
ncbi:MAG TPA: MaoC family dehydratase [Paraburkholderia sp.]|jgi:acyl dehydratase